VSSEGTVQDVGKGRSIINKGAGRENREDFEASGREGTLANKKSLLVEAITGGSISEDYEGRGKGSLLERSERKRGLGHKDPFSRG